VRGVLSLDLILTGIFVLGMFGVGGTLVTTGLHKAEAMLAQPVCRMYAQELANAQSLDALFSTKYAGSPVTASVINNIKPTNVVSATISAGKAIVVVSSYLPLSSSGHARRMGLYVPGRLAPFPDIHVSGNISRGGSHCQRPSFCAYCLALPDSAGCGDSRLHSEELYDSLQSER